MRNLSVNKDLRFVGVSGRPAAYRGRAFSLVELVVALGVLVLMFALAGQVFNFTVQSTGDATAIVEVNQQIRAFEQQLREDLAAVEAGRTVILIQGNPVNAYWTREGMEADDDGNPATGYPRPSDPEREFEKEGSSAPAPPRADMLMFFTSRRAKSYSDPAVTADLQQVVYGHAELGEYVPDPAASGSEVVYEFEGVVSGQPGAENAPMFPVDANGDPSPTEVCRVPASEWHLARRSVLIAPTYLPRTNPPGVDIQLSPVTRLDDVRLLEGATDIIAHFFLPPQAPSYTCPGGCPPFDYERDVLQPATVQDYAPGEASVFEAWQLPRIFVQGMNPFARSRLDLTPPPMLANRLAHYLLPNCASFKVEWTLDPRSSFVAGRLDGMTEVLWFDPGAVNTPFNPDPGQDDPLASLEGAWDRARRRGPRSLELNLNSLLNEPTRHPDGCSPYSLTNRFRSRLRTGNDEGFDAIGPNERPNTVAFVASRAHCGTRELVSEDIFPGALRITVDVFDSEGRLKRPIRHVMIIPVGP